MNIRNQRQEEFAEKWLKSDRFNIIHACPRFGKIKTAIIALNQLSENIKILISYPDIKIRNSWMEDFEKWSYKNNNITFTTHLSLKKYKEEMYDLIIIDEIHLLSWAQIVVCKELFKRNRKVMGLTGTLSKSTKSQLRQELGLSVLVGYPISQAIKEGVVSDYEINIYKVPLDRFVMQQFGKRRSTEDHKFKSYTYIIDKLSAMGKETKFMRLGRMRVVQNSLAKVNKTKNLLDKYKDQRVLVFCGTIKIAESLGVPSFHSKSSDKKLFEDFSNGIGNQLAVVKIGNTGITYKPLNRIIINSFDSNSEKMAQKINRCMSYEYNNPDKKAKIDIISSTEDVELKWLKKSLEFFETSKIKYL